METRRPLAWRLSKWLVRPRFDCYNWYDNGEYWLVQKLAAFHPAVVFDVGANVGDWLTMTRRALPDAEIHAFEIVDTTYARLRERCADTAAVLLNNIGLSDRAGTLTMHVYESCSGWASHIAYPHGEYRDVVCPVVRGDEYARQRGVRHIDLLKIDVEGAEHLVLKGFVDAIDTGDIDVIQFEYGKVNILTHFLLRDFYEFLEQREYSVGKLFPRRVDFRSYSFDDEDFVGPNFVAVRRARSDIIDILRGH